MMIPAIANKFALLWGFCDIWPGGHLYGSRLGNRKQVCIALGFCVYLRFCYEIKYNVKLINRQ